MRAAVGVQVHAVAAFSGLPSCDLPVDLGIDGLNLNGPGACGPGSRQCRLRRGAGVRVGRPRPRSRRRCAPNTEEAVARGVFGAPTMFVGGEMFFGQDRLDFVREALA